MGDEGIRIGGHLATLSHPTSPQVGQWPMGTEMVGFSVGVTFRYHARSVATHRGQRGPVGASWEGLEVANRLSSQLEPQPQTS